MQKVMMKSNVLVSVFPKNYIMYALYSVVAIFWNLTTMLPLCNWNDIT